MDTSKIFSFLDRQAHFEIPMVHNMSVKDKGMSSVSTLTSLPASAVAVPLLECLLERAVTVDCREHFLDSAHYAMENVEEKSLQRFQALVKEVTRQWGEPIYRGSIPSTEHSPRHYLQKAEWARESGFAYVALVAEYNPRKSRVQFYHIVLGAQRRHFKDPHMQVDILRHCFSKA